MPLGLFVFHDTVDSLGIKPDEANQTPQVRKSLMTYSALDNDNNQGQDKEYLDVVLIAYPHKGLEDTVRKEMLLTSNRIFCEAKSEDLDVRIFYLSFLGSEIPNINNGTSYATNLEDAEDMINRIPSIPITFEPKDYALYKTMKCITDELSSDFREDSDRFCFVVDALTFPKCSSNEACRCLY